MSRCLILSLTVAIATGSAFADDDPIKNAIQEIKNAGGIVHDFQKDSGKVIRVGPGSEISGGMRVEFVPDKTTIDQKLKELPAMKSGRVWEIPQVGVYLRGIIQSKGPLRDCGFALTDARLVHLAAISELTALNVGWSNISDAGLVHLRGSKKLQKLNLSHTRITDDGLKHLAKLKDLRILNLGLTAITNDGLMHLKPLRQLSTLDLYDTKIDDDGLVHLRQYGKLKSLNLDGTRVTDVGLIVLASMTSLEQVSVQHTDVTERGWKMIRKVRPDLRVSHHAESQEEQIRRLELFIRRVRERQQQERDKR